MKKVYIAAPYLNGDVVLHIRDVVRAAQELWDNGFVPFVPHLTHLWHLVCPNSIEMWYEYDLEWLPACDILLRLPGESKGADREVLEASRLGLPMYGSVLDLITGEQQ